MSWQRAHGGAAYLMAARKQEQGHRMNTPFKVMAPVTFLWLHLLKIPRFPNSLWGHAPISELISEVCNFQPACLTHLNYHFKKYWKEKILYVCINYHIFHIWSKIILHSVHSRKVRHIQPVGHRLQLCALISSWS